MGKGLKIFLSMCLGLGMTCPFNSLKINAAKLVGLENTGNSCYFNSALQMLYNCDQFKQVVDILRESGVEKDSVPGKLVALFEDMDKATATDGKLPVISKEKMQDVSELFSVDHKKGDDVDQAFSNIYWELQKNESGKMLCDSIGWALNSSITDGCMKINFSRETQDGEPFDVKALLLQESINAQEKNCFLLCPPIDLPPIIELSESYSCSDSKFQLESLSVNTGGHFVACIRTDDNLWSCISDSKLEVSGIDFQGMLKKMFENPQDKITALMFSR